MGGINPHATPQTGRRTSGPFAVILDDEGYIVTCDIDETNPQRSVVTRWSGPDLDPLDADPDARHNRAEIFATKDYTQPDRIMLYTYRDPFDDGAYEIYLVDLDADPLNHIRVWDPPSVPVGRLDGLALSPMRTLTATPYWFWGCYSSTAPGTPPGVCRMDLRDLPNVVVRQIIESTEGVMFGWPFIAADGRQRLIAGYDPPGGPPGFSESGLRLYVESEPLWVAEADYPIDTDLWAPSFAMPARAQSAEVAGPDDLGRYFVVFSTHDLQDLRGPLEFGEYGKIVAAVIGDPASAVVVSRKQNHQVQIEPEPFILNGALQVAYSETQTGPLTVPDEGVIQERYIDLARFPTN
jgi:hypothetical protein